MIRHKPLNPGTKRDGPKCTHFSWSRVDSSGGPDACWPWTSGVNTWGYGSCQYGGKQVNASRAAFLANGGVADGLVVCHHCDNPICCNPAHLFAATQAENLADCRRKGRARGTFGVGVKHPRHRAKLTEEMVLEARRLYASGVPQTEIGRRWGIDSSCISRAIRGINWKHVA